MRYHQFSHDNLPTDRRLIKGHFALRAQLFPDWPAPNYLHGYEGDIFDTVLFDPIWSVVEDEDGEVLAVARMIPADANGTMIEAAWPELVSSGMPPAHACFEVHRLGVSRSLPPLKQMEAALFLRIELELYALQMERPWIVLMVAERLWRATLPHMTPLGPPMDVDGVPSVALSLEIDQAEIDQKIQQLVEVRAKLAESRSAA